MVSTFRSAQQSGYHLSLSEQSSLKVDLIIQSLDENRACDNTWSFSLHEVSRAGSLPNSLNYKNWYFCKALDSDFPLTERESPRGGQQTGYLYEEFERSVSKARLIMENFCKCTIQ